MKRQVSTGIVLSRTNYGEADRIVTFLTPDQGKLHVMARGVRKIKSRMAGGIELFSISEISYMQGRGELATLISARLVKHYGSIVHDIVRVQLGYALIKMLNRATEDQTESDYFDLLRSAFSALDDLQISSVLIDAWFQAKLLKLEGRSPNLSVSEGVEESGGFNFDIESARFIPFSSGTFNSKHIKVMRLLFSEQTVNKLARVEGVEQQLPIVLPLLTMLRQHFLKQ